MFENFVYNFLSKYSGTIGWVLLIIALIFLAYEIAATTSSPQRIRNISIMLHIVAISIILALSLVFLFIFYGVI